jgi:NitT/TauT family transport system substrate-binding protein
MNHRIISTAPLCFVALAIVAILSGPLPGAEEKSAAEKMRITYAANTLSFLVMFIAKDRGFYFKHGLDADLIQVRPNVAIIALLSGDASYTEVLGSAIRSAAKGAPIRAISTTIKAPFFSLAAHPQFKSIKDLKGKTIGVNAIGGTNYVSARLVLQNGGLDPDREAQLIPIGDQKLVYEALKIGRVDAVMATPPYSVILKKEGYPLLGHAADVVSIPFVGLCTTLQQIQSKRVQVKKVLKAEIEALRYLHGDPKGTIDVIRKRFSMDEPLAAEAYAVVSRAYSSDGRTPRQALESLLEMEKKDAQVPAHITPDQIYDPSLVEEALKELGG